MDNHDNNEYSLKEVQAGNRSEFAKLIDVHSDQIFRLAIKILGNEQDAEDVLQNTFLKAFQKIGSFEGRSNVSTWLYRIATNEALMTIRKRRPEINISEFTNEENEEIESPIQFIDWCCLPENELLSEETREVMDEAINQLSEALKIVFILRDIEGVSIQETGQILNLSETAVKTRLLRARLKLREKLTTYFGERLTDRSE
ncbi:MAG TPA: sigma-70 family RNA polymerase sigma factor [Anaerolineales bacterium]|nr:sigma-70 family RNA polymerase sigma factor [Anaerolineales bacterium]